MSRHWKLLSSVVLAFALLIGAAACGGDDGEASSPTAPPAAPGRTAAVGTEATASPTPTVQVRKYDRGVTDTTITLGGSFPFSGPAAAYGTVGYAEEAYFKKVNDEGGVNGRKIEFKMLDDSFSPDKTVQNARKLVEDDKVFALFSQMGTASNAAIIDYMNQAKVPQLFVGTGAVQFGANPKMHPYTMSFIPDYVSEGKIYATYLLKEMPSAKIAILYENDDYGKDLIKGIEDGLGDETTMVVKKVSYEVSDASVSAQVTQLKESGADVLYIAATPKFAIQAMITAKQLSWAPLILLNSVSQSTASVMKTVKQQAGDDAVSNVISSFYAKDPADPHWASDKEMIEYKDFMKKYYPVGNPDDAFNTWGYAFAQAMVEVLKRCGDELTRDNLMKQAASMTAFRIGILLPGVLVNTSENDFFPIQSLQLGKFDASAAKWNLFGDVIDVSEQ